jgi:Tol biopolymer transport system component
LERDGNREIYLWDDGSSQVANLSRHRAWDDSAAWSPDGRLTWVSQRDGDMEFYLLDRQRIMNMSENPAGDSNPAWSADGRLAW